MPSKKNTQKEREISDLWDYGFRTTDIALLYGNTRERISQYLRRIDRAPRMENRLRKESITEQRQQQVDAALQHYTITVQEISDQLGFRAAPYIPSARKKQMQLIRQAWIRALVIDRLRDFYSTYGRIPTTNEMGANGHPLHPMCDYYYTIVQLFGSVNSALRQAKLLPSQRGRPPLKLIRHTVTEKEPTSGEKLAPVAACGGY